MSRKVHSFAPWTIDAITVLGRQIAAERRLQSWTQSDLAERAGISVGTLIAIEKGSPGAAIGIVFEVAALLGIPLVGATDPNERRLIDTRLALLPARIATVKGDDGDDF